MPPLFVAQKLNDEEFVPVRHKPRGPITLMNLVIKRGAGACPPSSPESTRKFFFPLTLNAHDPDSPASSEFSHVYRSIQQELQQASSRSDAAHAMIVISEPNSCGRLP